jgi:hypothetical protein
MTDPAGHGERLEGTARRGLTEYCVGMLCGLALAGCG